MVEADLGQPEVWEATSDFKALCLRQAVATSGSVEEADQHKQVQAAAGRTRGAHRPVLSAQATIGQTAAHRTQAEAFRTPACGERRAHKVRDATAADRPEQRREAKERIG